MFNSFLQTLSLVAALLVLFTPSAARADWHEASTDHFLIYADAEESDLRKYAENLERFHSAMEHVTGRTLGKPSPSNRIKIYAVGSAGAVRDLAGSSGVAGFYLPRWTGSVAFVQSVKNAEGRPDLSTTILLHEYVHHFFAATNRFAMPLWMNEGAAEFFSSAYFRDDGSVYVGLTPAHRDFTMFWIEKEQTPVAELLELDWARLNSRNASAKDSFYGNSWLLYHFLSTTKERSGQLREYWLEVLSGTPSLEAAKSVFGDLGPLQRQINWHYRNGERGGHHVTADFITVTPVTTRKLEDGEAASIKTRIKLERGVSKEDAADLASDMRSIAKRFPHSPTVLSVLARAEYRAGNHEAAFDAANMALAIGPDEVEAHVYKGIATFRKARSLADPSERAATYDQAMEVLGALNALENDHLVPLVYTYRFFSEQGIVPSADAKVALARAADLAPSDQELWLITGMMHMNDGRIAEAQKALQPLASNPHQVEKAEQVRGLLAFLANKPEGQPIPVQKAITAYFLDE